MLVSTFSAGSAAQAYSPPSYQVSFAATTFLVNGALTIDAKAPVDNHSALVVGGNGGVNVLGNNGSGAFASIASLPAAAASLPGIALGDFNSDGIDDIAALGFILWGQSGNTYSQQNIAAPSGSGAVASGDINGDGISDLGFTQWGSNTVTIWLGGAGSPGSWVPATTPTQVPVGVNPFGLALGDLDGDGRAEIVSANGSNNSVTVYRGLSSAPYLTARADYTTAPGGYPTPDDITLADVNGDGSLDIVAVGRAPGQASTFLNNGSGIFGAAISSLIGPYNWDSRASAVADFNGDGLADIVVPIQWDLNAGPFNQVAVLLGDGTGHFEFEQDFAVGFGPYSQPTDVVAGDFNGDGRADFAVSNAGENSVTVMLNIPSVDTTAPVITVPADFTVEATGPSGAEVNWVTYASDNDDQVIIGCTPPWGSVFGLGTTKVECHATDSSGNIGYGSFRVSVVDTTAPIISVPADFTVEATGSSGAVVTYLASATDSVDGTVTTSCSSPSGSLFPFGFKTLVCSAVDAAGNSS